MKTERQSPSPSGSEGSSPRNDHDGDFADVERGSDPDPDDHQYQEYDVNTFLDNVLTGVGTDDFEIKRLGKVLRKACAEGNLVQLVRGVLHLVELYQSGKRSRSRSRKAAEGDGEKKSAPSNKGTQSSIKAVGEGQRRHEGAVPQGRNSLEGLTEIGREEHTGISSQNEAEMIEGLQGLERKPIILKREIDDERPPVENNDKDNGNTFNSMEEERSSPSRPTRSEDESSMSDNTSRIDPSYREGARAFKRRKRFRKTSQKKRKISKSESERVSSAGRECYSSSTESDVSRHRENSSSSRYSTTSSSSSRSQRDSSRHRETSSSRSESDVYSRRNDEEVGRVVGNWERSQNEAPEDIPIAIPTNNTEEEESLFKSDVSRPAQRSKRMRKRTKTHECPVCKKMWESKAHLKIHSAVHTKERPFHCPRPNCGKTFKSKSALARHLRSHDGDRDKPFKCAYPRCRKAFASQECLDEHKAVHMTERERPFTCDHPGCFADFPSRTTLRRHKGTHSEERPFKCGVRGCGKAYKAGESLKTHQKKCNHN